MSKSKTMGQVFTPLNVVSLMLDEAGYTGEVICVDNPVKILEPSFR